MLNDVTQLEQEIKALEKEKEYFKDWCKVYESRIETKDHIINQLEEEIRILKEHPFLSKEAFKKLKIITIKKEEGGSNE